ncbi:hypothetical protein DBR32_07140 [Taibaiella sp. KBW10]|uniref:T9SS type A sorting domain-containing protein n=1 Tax=Taibaiella sp. KBW10 TaxID=2153357 RepID=UPI000F5960FE|nr:T9SS type A sorting domain-containing protein [Taibaiella sp. KBW10]RQO31713.1 hypothetical protein DBR32_07140 [Taibaiella sp. KBW10]
MRKIIPKLILLLLVSLPVMLYAQYNLPQNKVWVMSKHAGLDFNGTQPVPMSSQITETECTAAVSDSFGSLRFYTDGSNIWNRFHNIMPNGLNINNTGIGNYTTTQGALIVPDPGNVNRYYVFTLKRYLYVNVVDMSLNNGLGDVVTTYPLKGIICHDTLGEKMVAIRGCNNNVWVVIRADRKPEFYSFQVKTTGLDTIPVISTAGYLPSIAYYQGQMAASSDGTKIVTCSTNDPSSLELFKFDHTSGIIYQSEVLDSNARSYGVAFSPDGNKIYYADMSDSGNFIQYDLIDRVRTVLGKAQSITQVKLGVNGKVYFISEIGSFMGVPSDTSYLGCINKPNVFGLGCQFESRVPSLFFPNSGTTGLQLNLPNEVVMAKPAGSVEPALANRIILDTLFCAAEPFAAFNLHAYPVFTNYMWDNGTTGTSRPVTHGGTYWVRYNTICGPRTDTFKVRTNNIPNLQLQYNAPVLSTLGTYNSYQWYKGGQIIAAATGPSLTVSSTGWYSLKVGGGNGCSDSAAYYVGSVTSIEDTKNAARIDIFPNPVQDLVKVQADRPITLRLIDAKGRIITIEKGNSLSLGSYASGLYFIQVIEAKSGRILKVQQVTKR